MSAYRPDSPITEVDRLKNVQYQVLESISTVQQVREHRETEDESETTGHMKSYFLRILNMEWQEEDRFMEIPYSMTVARAKDFTLAQNKTIWYEDKAPDWYADATYEYNDLASFTDETYHDNRTGYLKADTTIITGKGEEIMMITVFKHDLNGLERVADV
jgi:hypothetical protein